MARYPAIRFRQSILDFSRTIIFGVINVTPDSFSDGGVNAEPAVAVAAGLRAVEHGAHVLDIGGESTRPGAQPMDAEAEMARVLPVVRGLAGRAGVPISIDTMKAEVAGAALAAGAEIVNDVTGGAFDPAIVDVAARHGAAFVCGHVRGRTLAEVHLSETSPPTFDEVVEELSRRVLALSADLRARTWVDPGLGFGKRRRENVELLRRSGEIAAALGRPVLVGPSRKRFLGEITGRPVTDRDDATVGACLAAVACGAAAVRVHDVKRVRDALVVYEEVIGR